MKEQDGMDDIFNPGKATISKKDVTPIKKGNVHNKKENINSNDSIEIPVGKYFNMMRANPWILATVVLGVVLILVLIFGRGSGGGSDGVVVSDSVASGNLLSFINAQGKGTATLTSIDKKDGFYEVTVKYNGQDIPVLSVHDV